MSNLYRGPPIDASYQVSVHLAKQFQREDFFKSANHKQELPVVAMFVNGSGQNVQSLERTFYRRFLPSFSSFGWGVSEEKIKMWKVNGRQFESKLQEQTWPVYYPYQATGTFKILSWFNNQLDLRYHTGTSKCCVCEFFCPNCIIKGHNSVTIEVRYLKFKSDLYFINLHVFTKC